MEKEVSLWDLFSTFFKIGLFTFGGGYAMMAMMEEEFVQKKKWIKSEDMLDIVALSESTPGPVAINSATNLGFRMRGFWGALVATCAEILPAFVIMFIISLFLNQFMQIRMVKAAFSGIQCAVAVLIVQAGIRLFKSLPKDTVTLVIFGVVVAALLLIHIFSWSFSSLLFILAGAVVGFALGLCKKKEGDK